MDANETDEDGSVDARRGTPRLPGIVVVYAGGESRMEATAIGASGVVIGRDDDCDLPLTDSRASRQHVRVHAALGSFRVRDLGSRNGTRLDGSALTDERMVGAGSIIRIGRTLLLLTDDVAPFLAARPTEAAPEDAVVGPQLAAVHATIAALARAGSPVAIVGETGTGKELAARIYHDATARSGPLVAVNCATIPVGIAERVLFGAKRGAFSGATADAQGLVTEADGGTLFLDELGELDPSVQAKLLRVVEQAEVVPVGANRGRPVDLRVVAATHRELGQDVAANRFRADLYFRIAQPQVRLPPLRERKEEIPALVCRTLAGVRPDLGPHVDLVEACCLERWPGNVRELMTAVRTAAVHAVARGSDLVHASDLPDPAPEQSDLVQGAEVHDLERAAAPSRDLPSRAQIELALGRAVGNVSAAARDLGLHRTQLYRLLRRHGLKP